MMNKKNQDWVKYVDEQSDKVVKMIHEGTKSLSTTVKNEKKKMEVKAQIGEHTRALNKDYMRLGKAYYESLNDKAVLDSTQDIVDLIYTNQKVVDLLKRELQLLEKNEPVVTK